MPWSQSDTSKTHKELGLESRKNVKVFIDIEAHEDHLWAQDRVIWPILVGNLFWLEIIWVRVVSWSFFGTKEGEISTCHNLSSRFQI
jgi:hypothetical protein